MEVIRLNVGGCIYNTARATLDKYPNSKLGLMMNGDTPFSMYQDGTFFIDRDGQMFRYILNFCRYGKLFLPNHFSDYDFLEYEADFYQIEPLMTSITSSRQHAMKENQNFKYIEIVEEKYDSNSLSTNVASYPAAGSFFGDCTSLYGRTDDLTALPPELISSSEKLQTNLGSNYSKLTIRRCYVRLQIGEFLSERGWVKEHSNLSSSITAPSNTGNQIFEKKIHREVWKICRKSD